MNQEGVKATTRPSRQCGHSTLPKRTVKTLFPPAMILTINNSPYPACLRCCIAEVIIRFCYRVYYVDRTSNDLDVRTSKPRCLPRRAAKRLPFLLIYCMWSRNGPSLQTPPTSRRCSQPPVARPTSAWPETGQCDGNQGSMPSSARDNTAGPLFLNAAPFQERISIHQYTRYDKTRISAAVGHMVITVAHQYLHVLA